MKTYSARYFGIIVACTLSLFLFTAAQSAKADTISTGTTPQASLDGKQVAFYYGYYRRPGFVYYGPGPRYYRNYWGGWRGYGGCNRHCSYNRWGAPVQCVRRCW